jgi:hypothetical protein
VLGLSFATAGAVWAQSGPANQVQIRGPQPPSPAVEHRAGSAYAPSAQPANTVAPTVVAPIQTHAPSPPPAPITGPASQTRGLVQPVSYQESVPSVQNPPFQQIQHGSADRAYLADAQEPIAPPPPGAAAPMPVSTGSCSTGSCNDCGQSCGCNSCGHSQCCCESYFYQNGWYVGAEYLLIRPNFSSPVAAVERTTVVTGNTSTQTDREIPYEYDYDSDFRIYGGYRWGECGESIDLSYWRIDNDASFESIPVPADLSVIFAGFADNDADSPGERLLGRTSVELDVFDIDYTKRIPIQSGSPNNCGACCPLWDLAWSFGARFADYERVHENLVVNAAGAGISGATAVTEFVGAGPRGTLAGRRYFGDERLWSLYGKTGLALLLGDYEASSVRVAPVGAPVVTSIRDEEFDRIVPVLDLEFGLSRQFCCNTLATVGYRFQSWWELGQFEGVDVGDCNCLGSSNLLTLDGLFVSLEYTFGGGHCKRRCDPCCN